MHLDPTGRWDGERKVLTVAVPRPDSGVACSHCRGVAAGIVALTMPDGWRDMILLKWSELPPAPPTSDVCIWSILGTDVTLPELRNGDDPHSPSAFVVVDEGFCVDVDHARAALRLRIFGGPDDDKICTPYDYELWWC